MNYGSTIAPEHRDIEAWLGSKLEDPWASEKISSFLTNEILAHAKTKFATMETSIKLRLLHSFISLRKKSFKDMEQEIYDLLKLGAQDEDEWVRMISTMLMPLKEDKVAVDCVQGLDKVKAAIQAKGPPEFFPTEYQYLSARLLPPLPTSTTTNTHFVLKRGQGPSQINQLPLLKKSSTNLLRSSTSIRYNDIDLEPKKETPNGDHSHNEHNGHNGHPTTTSPPRHHDESDHPHPISTSPSSSSSHLLPATPTTPNSNWARRAGGALPPTPTRSPGSGLVSPLNKSGGMFSRFDGTRGAQSGERRGFQKRNKMQMIDIEEVRSITHENELKYKRKNSHAPAPQGDAAPPTTPPAGLTGSQGLPFPSLPLSSSLTLGPMGIMGAGGAGVGGVGGVGVGGLGVENGVSAESAESEKDRKKREKTEQAEQKKQEREEKKKKKAEEVAQKKLQAEEKRAEKEAKKVQTQAAKTNKRKTIEGEELTFGEPEQAHTQAEEAALPPVAKKQTISFAKPGELPGVQPAKLPPGFVSPLYGIQANTDLAHHAHQLQSQLPTAHGLAQSVAGPPAHQPNDSLSSLLSQALDASASGFPSRTPQIPQQITPQSFAFSRPTQPPPTQPIEPQQQIQYQQQNPQILQQTLQHSLQQNLQHSLQHNLQQNLQQSLQQNLHQQNIQQQNLQQQQQLYQQQLLQQQMLKQQLSAQATNPQTTNFANTQATNSQFTNAQPTNTQFTNGQPTNPAQSNLQEQLHLSQLAQQQPPQQQPPTPEQITPEQQAQAVLTSLFEQANQLTPEHKELIIQFFSGNRVNPNPEEPLKQIPLNYEQKANVAEMIIFEINYTNGSWRKFRRKKNVGGKAPLPTGEAGNVPAVL